MWHDESRSSIDAEFHAAMQPYRDLIASMPDRELRKRFKGWLIRRVREGLGV